MMQNFKKLLVLSVGLTFFSGFSFGANVSVWDLFGEHIAIGLGHSSIATPSLSQVSNILELQREMNNQISYDILRDLDFARTNVERSLVVSNYLSRARQLFRSAQQYLDREELTLSNFDRKIKECEAPITQYNADFSRAVENYNYVSAQRISAQIADLRGCIAENTVLYRERVLYRDMLSSAKTALEKRITYIESQQDKIVSYYDILKPQLLKELYDVSQTLQVNFAS